MSVDFLDSNIFVYLLDETDDRRREIAEQTVEAALVGQTGVISYQVVQETLNVITTKIPVPLVAHDARRFLDTFLVPLWRVMPRRALYDRGLELKARYGFAFYDSLIVAAALEAGCTRLLTEDLHDGQRIEGITIENPFRA